MLLKLIALLIGKHALSKNIVFDQPAQFQSNFLSDAKYQPCEDFDVIYGNATKRTNLWVIAEDHDATMNSIQCLEKLTKNVPEHVIYMEGFKRGEEIPCTKFNVPKKPGRVCKGWDNLAARDTFLNYFDDYEMLQKEANLRDYKTAFHKIYLIYETEHSARANEIFKLKLQEERQEWLKPTPAKNKNLKESGMTSKEFTDLIDWIEQEHKKGKSYPQILKSQYLINHRLVLSPKKELGNVVKAAQKRDKALIKTIRHHPERFFGVIIVGKGHVAETAVDAFFPAAARPNIKKVRASLDKFADVNPFAVLAPK